MWNIIELGTDLGILNIQGFFVQIHSINKEILFSFIFFLHFLSFPSIIWELNAHIDTILFETQLKVGQNDVCIPCNGRWNFNKKVSCYSFTIRFSELSKIWLTNSEKMIQYFLFIDTSTTIAYWLLGCCQLFCKMWY